MHGGRPQRKELSSTSRIGCTACKC
ncbi:hypothetical protein LINGRAHAP2_LOCUS36727 [Linum grandiflorum]